MADINVTYQTQKIIVDPSTNSISVIQAGPQGPGGPTGEVTTAQLTAGLATKADVAGDLFTGTTGVQANNAKLTVQGDTSARLDFTNTDGATVRYVLYTGSGGSLSIYRGALAQAVMVANSAGVVSFAGATSLTVPATQGTNQAVQLENYSAATGRFSLAGMELGDTGWRDISTLMSSRFTTITHAKLRRAANVVHMIFHMTVDGSTLSGGTNWLAAAGNIPVGFRPDYTVRTLVASAANGAVLTTLYYSTTLHALGASGGISAGTTVLVDHTFTTTNSWPTSLPGTQVTAPFSL